MAGNMEVGKTMGDWKVLKILGKGSYGTVGLLQNSKTKAHIGMLKYSNIQFKLFVSLITCSIILLMLGI